MRLQCPSPSLIVSMEPLPALANSFLRGGGGGLTEPFWVGAWDGRVGSSRALRAEAAGGVAAWASHCSPAQQGPWHGLLPPTIPSTWALLEEGLVLGLEEAEPGLLGAPGGFRIHVSPWAPLLYDGRSHSTFQRLTYSFLVAILLFNPWAHNCSNLKEYPP